MIVQLFEERRSIIQYETEKGLSPRAKITRLERRNGKILTT